MLPAAHMSKDQVLCEVYEKKRTPSLGKLFTILTQPWNLNVAVPQ